MVTLKGSRFFVLITRESNQPETLITPVPGGVSNVSFDASGDLIGLKTTTGELYHRRRRRQELPSDPAQPAAEGGGWPVAVGGIAVGPAAVWAEIRKAASSQPRRTCGGPTEGS